MKNLSSLLIISKHVHMVNLRCLIAMMAFRLNQTQMDLSIVKRPVSWLTWHWIVVLTSVLSYRMSIRMKMALMSIKFAQRFILSLMKMMILISLHELYKSSHQVFHKFTTLVYLQVRTILKQSKHEVMVVKSTVIILMKKKSRQWQKLKWLNVQLTLSASEINTQPSKVISLLKLQVRPNWSSLGKMVLNVQV